MEYYANENKKFKVSEIEFHINRLELDDMIIRAAELVKDGYHLSCFDWSNRRCDPREWSSEPEFTIIFHK